MNKNAFPVMYFIVLIVLFGCQQAEEIETSDENLQMSIEASVGKNGIITGRSTMNNEGQFSFTENDMIGLSVNGGDFVKWTYNGSSWEHEGEAIYWKNKDDKHEFCAFYPFVDNATLAKVPMPDLTKQKGEKEDLGSFDFLVTTKEQIYGTNGVVSFSGEYAFEHVLSLITITLKGEGDLFESTINKISISGTDIVTPYTYSFEDSDTDILSDEDDGIDFLKVEIPNGHKLTSNGLTLYFVLNAGTVELSEVDLSIEYTSGTKNYTATLEGMGDAENTKFASGKQYNYSLKVVGGELSITGNEINDWEDGINLDNIIIDRQENQTAQES